MINRVRTLSLTCALFATACGGSDNKPAQDPLAASTTSAPTDVPASTSMASSSAMPSTTRSATDTTNATMSGPTNAGTGTMPSTTPPPTNATPVTNPSTPPTGPAVAQNPGVADGTKNADNTKVNDRDRHGALTPMDQGNSSSETKITASIRRGIMADKTLSFASKNVKVITVGTKVTLRGAVKSDQERAAIESVAKQTTGVTEVDNQLEVKK